VIEPRSPVTERHYTIREIADMWNISYQTARRMFQDQPGVLAFSMRRMCGQGRPHVSLRVPASVLERFYKERTAGFSLAKVQRGRG
jgi:hypothetical protein